MADNIVVYHFESRTFDEIIDRIYDESYNATHVVLKNAGAIPLEQLDRDYGLAHEARNHIPPSQLNAPTLSKCFPS